ncbi:MAG: hypothetical protein JO233_05620, partial [Candidatus Eremiobacteraeota bacterium]|nr:hypothetical protein [Candidatus Eremiobacteraeota bacterium]
MRSVRHIRIRTATFSGTLLRFVFAAVFGVTGFLLGREAYLHLFSLHFANEAMQIALTIVSPVIGALIGVALAPVAQSFFEDELNAVENAIDRLAPAELAGGAVGLIVGLIVAFLIKNILFEFITVAGRAGSYIAILLYIIISVFTAYLGARVGAKQRLVPLAESSGLSSVGSNPKIVDTSVIVDGRITEIVESGFLEGPLILPRFVLRELQLIADSLDSIKRV